MREKIFIFSGATQQLLFTPTGPSPFTGLGSSVQSLGDVDGDGFRDFGAGKTGGLRIFSGRTRQMLWDRNGFPTLLGMGVPLEQARDMNGDGLADILAGAPKANTLLGGKEAGLILALSGKNGSIRRSIEGTRERASFGASIQSLEDLDGDGLPEVAVRSPNSNRDFFHEGDVRIFSRGGS
ncbi:MAG: FG-GAP repeat domain-containing protein, partial [Planctomycetota bacterium]